MDIGCNWSKALKILIEKDWVKIDYIKSLNYMKMIIAKIVQFNNIAASNLLELKVDNNLTKNNDIIFLKREVEKMRYLSITDIFIKRNKINGRIIDFNKLRENIIDYRLWLEKTHRKDKIENYEKFLQAQ
jgi:hypothetical protein